MANLEFVRPEGAWANRYRSVLVMVDGVVAAQLRQGQSCEFETTPGVKSVVACIDGFSTKALLVDVAECRSLRIEVVDLQFPRERLLGACAVICLALSIWTQIFDSVYLVVMMWVSGVVVLYGTARYMLSYFSRRTGAAPLITLRPVAQ